MPHHSTGERKRNSQTTSTTSAVNLRPGGLKADVLPQLVKGPLSIPPAAAPDRPAQPQIATPDCKTLNTVKPAAIKKRRRTIPPKVQRRDRGIFVSTHSLDTRKTAAQRNDRAWKTAGDQSSLRRCSRAPKAHVCRPSQRHSPKQPAGQSSV